MPQNFLTATWQKLIMANYEVDASTLIPYLPKGVELDDFQGKHLVSLVGFMFVNTRLFGIPIPLLGSFEEVNLRFYVKRKIEGEWRRGVIFVNESVPYAPVAWLANVLYKEHYTALRTWHKWESSENEQHIAYGWKKQNKSMGIQVYANLMSRQMSLGSEEEFIFEHYYGYTRVSALETWEYKVNHPAWEVFEINSFEVDCDFGIMYGQAFQALNLSRPSSVFLAEGSGVSVAWKRNKI